MIKIEFAVPMVDSVTATMDMTEEQSKTARKLFANALMVEKTEDGIRLVEGKNAPKDALYGSAAVLAYRDSLGLEARPMKQVPVYPILMLADTPDETYDLLHLILRVKSRNDRVKRLLELGAPQIIMMNECRMLWEATEKLLFNRFTPRPDTVIFPGKDDEEEETHIRVCVMDLMMKEVSDE